MPEGRRARLISKEASFKNHDRFIQLGIAISTLRRMRGLSQEKLAEKAGLPPISNLRDEEANSIMDRKREYP